MPLALPTPTPGTTPAPWNFQAATLTGVPFGDITEMSDRKLTFGLSVPSTFEGKLDIAHPRMADIMTQQHFLIKGYRRGELKELWECQTGELVLNESERSIAITGQNASYKQLSQRYIGQSTTGFLVWYERTAGIAAALAEANAAAETGIRIGTAASAGAVTAGPYRYKQLLELVNDLGKTLSGYDHWITSLDPNVWGGLTGLLNMAPLRGSYREDALLEYGTGRANARELKLLWKTGDRITRAISLPPSFPDNAALVAAVATNLSDNTAGIRRREALIESDLVDNSLRQALVNEHAYVREGVQQIFSMQPHVYDGTGRTPEFLRDFDIGDIIEGRALEAGLVILDALVRVYGATIEIDNAGVETVTLTMVDEGS